MAKALFCRPMISWPKLFRPLCDASSNRLVSSAWEQRRAHRQRLMEMDESELPSADELMADWPDFMRENKEQRAFVEKYRGREPEWSAVLISFKRGGFVHLEVLDPLKPARLSSCNWFLEEMSFNPDNPKLAKPFVARPFLAQMLVYGAIPDLSTFSILTKSYCKDLRLPYHHIHGAVFTQMKSLGVKGDESFYKSLIDEVCARFGHNVGYQLLEELRLSEDIEMPFSFYDAFVARFCERKMIDDAAM